MITQINWSELRSRYRREGNPFGVQPTAAMLHDAAPPIYRSYLIDNQKMEFFVIYDRNYCLQWAKARLSFLSGLPESEILNFISETFSKS